MCSILNFFLEKSYHIEFKENYNKLDLSSKPQKRFQRPKLKKNFFKVGNSTQKWNQRIQKKLQYTEILKKKPTSFPMVFVVVVCQKDLSVCRKKKVYISEFFLKTQQPKNIIQISFDLFWCEQYGYIHISIYIHTLQHCLKLNIVM